MCVWIPPKELYGAIRELGKERVEMCKTESLFPLQDVDKEGFLLQPENWSEDIAELLAQREVSGDLTEDHWQVVRYLRQYYLHYDSVPPVRMLCRDTGLSFVCIRELFPSGLAKGACKIAGIPRTVLGSVPLYP